jgi:predicted Zn-dependent peptidase
MLVVIVGGLSRQEVVERMRPLANLPGGSYKAPVITAVAPQQRPQVLVTDRPNSPTTYVYAAFPGPRMDDPLYWPLAVGLRHLRDVLFEEIRTKRNLSYAPGGFLGAQLGSSVGFLTVSSTLPDSSIHVIYRELEKMRRGDFTESDLEDTKQSYLTGYYMGQMTNASRAAGLYNAERNGGGWKSAYSYDAINAVNKKAVQAAFQTYAKNLAVGVVGTAQQVTQADYSFRE